MSMNVPNIYFCVGNGYCCYSGSYAMGLFEGEGEFRCFSGAWYKGQWSRGLRHGQVGLIDEIYSAAVKDVGFN